MKFIKLSKELNNNIEIEINKYLRKFETKCWSAFWDLKQSIMYDLKLDLMEPQLEKLEKQFEEYIDSYDYKIKSNIKNFIDTNK